MASENNNTGKWIHRVSQKSAPDKTNTSEPAPWTPKHFNLKTPPDRPDDMIDAEPASAAFHRPDGVYSGRIRKDPLPSRNSTKVGRMTGDWMLSVPGRVFVVLVKIAFIVGLVWGGIYLWHHDRHLLFFAAIILLLVWGIISAGMQLGERSPFKQDASWVASWYPWWFY